MKIITVFGDKKNEYNAVRHRGAYISAEMNIPLGNMCFMEQVHTDNVLILEENIKKISNRTLPECDAMLTNQPNVFLSARTADCFPVLFYDIVRGVIGIAHAGREGVRLRITEKVIMLMKDYYWSKPQDIKIIIGPGISKKNYHVSAEIMKDFYQTLGINDFSLYLDLKEIIISSALDNNVPEKNISVSTICTFDDENYFSYRRDKTRSRQLSLIGMVYV